MLRPRLLGGALEEWIVDAQLELDGLRAQLEENLGAEGRKNS